MTPLRMLLTMWRKNRSSGAEPRRTAARAGVDTGGTWRRREPTAGRLGMGEMSVSAYAMGKRCARAAQGAWRQKSHKIRQLAPTTTCHYNEIVIRLQISLGALPTGA